MLSTQPPVPAARAFDWPLAAKCILGFWALHLVYRSIIYAFGGRLGSLLDPTLWSAFVLGVALAFGMCALLAVAVRRGLAWGLGLAVLIALPASLSFATCELILYYHLSPEVNGTGQSVRVLDDGTVVTRSTSGEISYRRKGETRPTVVKLSPVKQQIRIGAVRTIATNATGWYFFYFGLGAFFVGMSSAGRLRQAERRAAEFERLAQEAQLRALRYQINPHFLFNTLNSLSSLIMSGRQDRAEGMILSLSAFLRSTLALDPADDVTLKEEIALQQLYLDIERARFPERLHVNIEVPQDLQNARVPALLLQPIVENAVKYGVARANRRVTLAIRAEPRGEGGGLSLIVENDLGGSGETNGEHQGTGVGLANVCERLAARFGEAASCEFGRHGESGYRVAMNLPLVLA